MRLFNFFLLGQLALSILLSACAPAAGAIQPVQVTARPTAPQATSTPMPTATSQPTATPVTLTEDQLKNARYNLPDLGEVQLSDGQFEQSIGVGASQVNRVGFLQAAFGDLDGDRVEDAAVVLWANLGGSGTFIYLIAARNQAGMALPGRATLLGDRVQVQSLAVEAGQIIVGLLDFGPDDPLCCPSQPAQRVYRLSQGTLILVSEVQPANVTSTSVP